ncbi:unnamed protein product [Adineta steineri]|uniref:Transient receptor potential cation channel subfamily A member 1 n=1 Tax=Adineta steineri TaxID=433720 RepID=A0A813XMD8_9BILA|nr:unnamed protein product [Adineta steineri]
MDTDTDQLQLLSDSSVHRNDTTITEETLLIDDQPNEDEGKNTALDWSTSMISEICREGDLVRLRDFIEYSKQTSHCGRHAAEIADRLDVETGLSPLHHAARYQQLDICIILLSNIAFKLGVNIKDAYGRTPIHSAFRSSNNSNSNKSNIEKPFDIENDLGDKIQATEIWQDEYKNKIPSSDHPLIYLFAKANGNIRAGDKYLLTPLHYAVARNNLAGVKQLITLQAEIEAEDRQEIRPLHLACREGYLSIAEYLLEQGAKINAEDADNWTPLHYACAKGHIDIIKLIKSKEKLNFENFIEMKTNTGASCLHLAVQNGNTQTVKYILTEFNSSALKELLNEQVESFGTPLHIAAKFCDPSMLDLLYDNGADPLILNSHDQSSLHIASASNRLPIVQKLIALTEKSLLEIKDDQGHTALSVTTNFDIINELITYGADISSLNNNHMNVLMIAVSKGQLLIVEHLLLMIKDQFKSIFDQVTKGNNRSIFLIAVETGSIDMCSLLLNHPYIRWDTIDKQRMNAFHIAARNNHYKLIEFLSERLRKSGRLMSIQSHTYSMTDADLINIPKPSPMLRLYIDAQNEDGETPLYLAAEHGHTLCVAVLIKHGVDVLLPNYLGQLVLHIAIQNGHSQCVELLMNACMRNMTDFQSALARRQSPLITACQNGFADIVRLLLVHPIEIYYDENKEKENPLEIAIKYHQIEILHILLEHPHTEHWLMAIKDTKEYIHQTPLRHMIRHIPECAKHAFDKLLLKTDEIDTSGNISERITYRYKYIDDYFTDDGKLYTPNSHQLYRNHPLIIALDTEHHSLLQHPLVKRLISHKWKLYCPFFYISRILSLLSLLLLTIYVLNVPLPYVNSSTNLPSISMKESMLPVRWIIIILAAMNLFKIILEIFLFRGLRVPFAQIFGIISYLSSIIAFIPYQQSMEMIKWQWQFAAFSVLFQWFNTAFILRSVPFIGKFIVMFQSVLFNFFSLIFVTLPLLVAFTIGAQMIFFNHQSFFTVMISIHKITAMLIGEFDFETLVFSKPTFIAAKFLFILFIIIMTMSLMNLLLGLTVKDIQSCMKNSRAQAHAYRIRELIYIESILPNKWLKSKIIETEYFNNYDKDLTTKNNDEIDEDYNESQSKRQPIAELGRLLDILDILCKRAKQVLEKEINLEKILTQLLAARKAHSSKDSSIDTINTSGQ